MTEITAADFQAYNPDDASTIEAGPLALYTVSVDSIQPTQMNEGLTEVDAKAAGYDLFTSLSQVESDLLGDIEPVVIGPNGQLYLLDGHHTFTALIDSVWGADDPTVEVNVIANYSGLATAQFFATMQQNDYLLPLNDGVPETVDDATGAPIPMSLTDLTSDVYRGLEYSILKNKSSKLFTTTNNITGAVGASTPGLDKMPGLYSDFFEAAAYQDANDGLGLPYLSPGDIALATQWNLTATSVTTLPSIPGTVTAAQLPGFILPKNDSLTVSQQITNATLDENGSAPVDPKGNFEAGALAGNGSFTGVTEINAGTQANPIMIGTANIGFIMQLGSDNGSTVTLSNADNLYTGGTTILAGDLVIASDGSLGAAPSESAAAFESSLTFDSEGFPDNVTSAVQADDGVIFNSLSEGNGTLTIGTVAGQFSIASPFTTSRPIAVGNEAATINVNGNVVELNGPLVTLGYDNLGLGETAGFPALTIDDLSSGGGSTSTAGKLILSTASPNFHGDIIIGNVGTPIVEVMSDAALGATTGSPEAIGEIELNGGTLQTGASISAPERDIVLDGGSQIDLNGQSSSWGSLTDVKRTIAIGNSSTTAGSITFSSLAISQTSILQLDGSANGVTYSGNETVTFTNGVQQTADTDTLFIDPSSATALGTSTEKVFSSGASTTLVNGMAPAWIVTDSGGGASTNPYNFVTYGPNGYVNLTYSDSGSGSSGGIRTANSASTVDQTGNATLAANAAAYALKVNDGAVITAGSFTITLGDGADPAGLILGGGNAAITGGALAFGGSQAIIYAKGTSTISSEITGSDGLTLAGSGTLVLSAAAPFTSLSGPITIDSGELSLTTANLFASDVAGLTLDDVKSHPSNSILNFTASQTFTTLNDLGDKSAITFSGAGVTLTVGDTTNNFSSTLSSAITQSGAAVAGALTFDGSGLFDLSGMSSATLSLASGSSIIVNNTAQLRVVASEFANANFGVDLAGAGSQLQFAQNGGGQFANAITGVGEVHLIGGTLQLTEAAGANRYTGGTVVETGSTLDLTTNQVSTGNANVTDAGGLIVFDQDFAGAYSGVISDGLEMGVGPMLSGSLDIDDSAADSAGSADVTLSNAQTYSGATYIEAGTLTLGVANAIADSSGVTLGRVGGAATGIVGGAASGPTYTQTANLVLEANNTLTALSSNAGNATSVVLNGNTLTLDTTTSVSSVFGGAISDGSSSGALVVEGTGDAELTGANTFTGGVTLESGVLELGANGSVGSNTIAYAGGAELRLDATVGGSTAFGNTLANMAVGDQLDLVGLQYISGSTSATLSGSELTVTDGASSETFTLNDPAASHFQTSEDSSGGVLVTGVYAPTIAGVAANQMTTNEAPIDPFSGVTIGDQNANATDTLTITLSGGGALADGTGFDGLTSSGPGVYALTGTTSAVTDELDGLVFTPVDGVPNTSATTTFTLSDLSSAYATPTTNDTTSVTDNDPAVAPTITGVAPDQEIGVQETTKPFSGVKIGDANAGTMDTLTIALSGGGTLSGAGLTGSNGIYSLSGAAGTITSELEGLVFTPAVSTTHSAATTTFSLTDATSANTSATNDATTVLVDPGPSAKNASATVKDGTSVDLTSLILAEATPGIKGDTLTITADNTTGALGSVSLVNGDLVYSTTTAALSNIPANGSATDSFGFTVSDQFGDGVSATADITVTNPADVINGPIFGFGKIEGTTGADIINASGYFNTIYDNGGNDVVNAGLGDATVYADGGDVVVNLQGYFDSVSGGSGNDAVSGSAGDAAITLGNGADFVSVGGYFNSINLGSGNDTVIAGQGDALVALGGGEDKVTLAGYGDSVTAGNGNDVVTGGAGLETIALGNGNDRVSTAGYLNVVHVGSGADTIVAGSGLDTVIAGSGSDTITLGGEDNSVVLDGSMATVAGGQGEDTIVATGGKDQLTFAGWGSEAILSGTVAANITDRGDGLLVAVKSGTETDTIVGFGDNDKLAVLDLFGGAGGYSSVSAILGALHSDGHGGTLLALGTTGSIDFVGTTASQLHASNFRIG